MIDTLMTHTIGSIQKGKKGNNEFTRLQKQQALRNADRKSNICWKDFTVHHMFAK